MDWKFQPADFVAAGGLHAALIVGDLVNPGTLTESKPIGAGETWTAAIDEMALPALTPRIGG